MNTNSYRMGVDIGSTTAKVVILNSDGEMAFSSYRRHSAETLETLQAILREALQTAGNITVDLLITGSAGMGITEKYDLPFIQEVVASAEVIRQRYPQVKTLIDIGGEDAKIIFFDADGRPDIRMNGSCAGGTGAFIDEMASLLNVPISELDALAHTYTTIYPIASRCGVFAKTDLQNLLSRQIAKEDIAASVFHAVVLQTLAALARGRDPLPALLFSGGPLAFMSSLKNSFLKVLKVSDKDVVSIENPELLPALGAALTVSALKREFSIQELIDVLSVEKVHAQSQQNRVSALFGSQAEFEIWNEKRSMHKIDRIGVSPNRETEYFLGIDSGSTTTKLVLIDVEGRVAFSHYANNGGHAINAAQKGLGEMRKAFEEAGYLPKIARSIVTGYGEDLIKAALGIDEGMVETLAHFRAAKAFDPNVTTILDIGGQDMKAIFVQDGNIQNIEINEACSSGCGSFIESFARSMGHTVVEFARLACVAEAPFNLGTRCTVFMNSRVKQALREGANISEISAGLAYSVVKNALHKVLKVTNVEVLGDHVVVQGGTFRNPAVHKALELILGKTVVCPDLAELMGAYGAALTARDVYTDGLVVGASSFVGLENINSLDAFTKKDIQCRGCENNCAITRMVFANNKKFYSGHRCERIYANGGKAERKGVSMPTLKNQLLFEREMTPVGKPLMTIGIPRALNMFENFPFWNALLVESGIQVKLSDQSSNALYQEGAAHIMSENLCFPGKLVSGHIMDLINAKVDRIFYPMVFYERKEFKDASNTFNCPIVSGYPDVIRSAMNPEGRYNVPFDIPSINFSDEKLLKKACKQYLSGLGVPTKTINQAFEKANQAQADFKQELRDMAKTILDDAKATNRPVVMAMGRPYHIDPMVNHNVPDLLTDFGVDVITEDAILPEEGEVLDNRHVMTQWEYMNRYFYAARWVGQQKNVELVQLNSFGCGPDPFLLEEIKIILGEYGKKPTIIRIDEVESTGSTKLRLRSMMESLRRKSPSAKPLIIPRKTTRIYQKEDRDRTLLIPDFSPFCSPPITRPFTDAGYRIVQLPKSNYETVDVGLKYTNNEMCYPGIIIIGDIVKALQSGKYDLSKTAIAFSQTGGQCRATSYPSMIKKSLVSAGFADVPVVTLSTNMRVLNEQPGFEINTREYVYKAALGMMFTDALSDMYHSSVIREKQKGATWQVASKYLNAFTDGSIPVTKAGLLDALEHAVDDFNALDVTNLDYPKVGIVGEVYVKYNSFSNNNVVQWLVDQGIEVVMPSFMEFFSGGLVSTDYQIKSNIAKHNSEWLLSILGQKLVSHYLAQFTAIARGYRHYRPTHDIEDIAKYAEEILSLSHQYGESWLIAGQVAALAKSNVPNVLCLQPFGCISNHVVAKGIQKRLKDVYPQLNILLLDADAGVSEVNFFNRMHFFVSAAKEGYYQPDDLVLEPA